MNNRGNDGTAVIAAMRLEARTARPFRRLGWRVVTGGVGPERARIAASTLLDAGAKRLLIWGTAGSLNPDLEAGTLLVPATVIDPQGRHHAPDADWRAALLARIPVTMPFSETALATVARPVADPPAKKALHAATGAGAVDMETASIAALAVAQGVPFAVVRAVVDPVKLALPPVVLAAISDRFLAPEVALRLLGRPQDLPAVLALGRALRHARHNLSAFARAVAAAGEDRGLY
ncbi:MAG: hypothetical protein ACRER1_02645 [Gammaproteobacteria bacterium]